MYDARIAVEDLDGDGGANLTLDMLIFLHLNRKIMVHVDGQVMLGRRRPGCHLSSAILLFVGIFHCSTVNGLQTRRNDDDDNNNKSTTY